MLKKINLFSLLFIVIVYIIGFFGIGLLFSTHLSFSFIIFNICYYVYNNLSFTIGWHRFFVHKAFKTNRFIEWLLFLGGASLFIGSLSEWISDHNQHHKHLNEEEDPTNINKGFFYSHLGWAVIKKENTVHSKNDLLNYWHRTYSLWAILFGLIIPVSVSYLLSGNFIASFCISFGLRVLLSQNIIGLLGSYCHKTGLTKSVDSHFISFICFGEGYQDYHHKYPGDYRNGPKKLQLDSSKWIIYFLYKLGLVKELRVRE